MRRIQPTSYFEGEFTLPGDKSITHRAIMLNSGADGEAVITSALLGEDCLSTVNCMRALGARIETDSNTLHIKGTPRFKNGKALYCGNSGTTMRLLAGFLAGKGIEATLCGDDSLSARPMERVSIPLRQLGAEVHTTEGRAPVYISPKTLTGADIVIPVASAQVKSAVLLAGLCAEGETSVTEPIKARDHTERMLTAMGAGIRTDGNTVFVKKSNLQAVDICVPSDISSAAYFMALGALKGKTLCKGVGVNPTRTGILHAFDKLGVRYVLQNQCLSCGEEVADILVEKSEMRAITLSGGEVPSMIDELPLIALLCAFADGETHITGAQELSLKESDRIRATAELINALGGDCTPFPDGFIIRGREKLKGGVCHSFGDHRIAMSGAVGLLASENGGELIGEECCAVSFPNFFEMLGVGTR